MPLDSLGETETICHWLDRGSIQAFRSCGRHESKAVFAWIGDVVSARCWSTARCTVCDLHRRGSCTGAKSGWTPARLMDTQAFIIPRGRHRGLDSRGYMQVANPERDCAAQSSGKLDDNVDPTMCRLWSVDNRHRDAVGWSAPHNPINGAASSTLD